MVKNDFLQQLAFVRLSVCLFELIIITVVFGRLTYSNSTAERKEDTLDLFSLVMNLFPLWQRNTLHEPPETPAS